MLADGISVIEADEDFYIKSLYNTNILVRSSNFSDNVIELSEGIIDNFRWMASNLKEDSLRGEENYKFKKILTEVFPALISDFSKLSNEVRNDKRKDFIESLLAIDNFSKLIKEAVVADRIREFEVSKKFTDVRI